MSKFNQETYNSILYLFSQETGVPTRHMYRKYNVVSPRTVLILVVLLVFVTMAAFTYPLFSPLNGDALTLEAEYQGNGIVSVSVMNHSKRALEFQPQLKLVKWVTEEEVTPLSDEITFDGLKIAPNSPGTLMIDLSKAYDMDKLEESLISEWYYLVLTNQNFLFGQEWKCSVYFGKEDPYQEETPEKLYSMDPRIIERIDEDFRYYFEDDFLGFLAANPLHYEYLQKVQEMLLRSGKNIVPLVDAMVMVGPSEDVQLPEDFLRETPPQNSTVQDAFGKLVGATTDEHIKKISYFAPVSEVDTGESYEIPLLYYATFERLAMTGANDCAFIHGQMVTFEELAPYKVYENETHICYNVTHLFYTDLRGYVDDIIEYRTATDQHWYMDDEEFARIQAVYDYYTEHGNLMTWEEFIKRRGNCALHEKFEGQVFPDCGLAGYYIVSDQDIEKVEITVCVQDGEKVYEGTFIPNSTDSQWSAYGYELSEAVEAEDAIRALPAGTYVIEVTVHLNAELNAKRSLWECVFTVE